jgi:hypothetical protein
MYSETLDVDGDSITVEQGDAFRVQSKLEFGEGRVLEDGDVVTIGRISKQMDGVHFDFVADGEPGDFYTIYKFALENNLEEGYMSLL